MTEPQANTPVARLAWDTPELIDLDAELENVQLGGGPPADNTALPAETPPPGS